MDESIFLEKTVNSINDPEQLTNGEVYMLIKDLIESTTGDKYE